MDRRRRGTSATRGRRRVTSMSSWSVSRTFTVCAERPVRQRVSSAVRSLDSSLERRMGPREQRIRPDGARPAARPARPRHVSAEINLRSMIEAGELERVDPDPGAAAVELGDARNHLRSAEKLVGDDPIMAYSAVYDATRKALAAHMRAHRLQDSREGGHQRSTQRCASLRGEVSASNRVLRSRRLRIVRNDADSSGRRIGRQEVAADLETGRSWFAHYLMVLESVARHGSRDSACGSYRVLRLATRVARARGAHDGRRSRPARRPCWFLLVVLPFCIRRFGRDGESRPKASGRAVVGFAAFLTVLTAIEVALIPDFGLGTIFWIVAILIPSLEFLGFLSRRESRMSAESESTS